MRVPEHVGFNDLGVVEYWIMDGDTVLVKAACRPFMVGSGLTVRGPEGEGESQRTFTSPRPRVAKRPGFLSQGIPNVTTYPFPVFGPEEGEESVFGSEGESVFGQIPNVTTGPRVRDIFGFEGLGFFEVLAPTGEVVASFRCRPYWVMEELTVKQAMGRRERIVEPGSAPVAPGTMAPRRGIFRTVRRG